MAKRIRERDLTQDEAIEQARAQLAPYWVPRPALLAGVRGPNGAQGFPLDKKFSEKRWAILGLDPACGSTEENLKLWKEFVGRYLGFNLNFLCLISNPFPFYGQVKNLDAMATQFRDGEVLSVDMDGVLSEAISGPESKRPFLAVYDRGNRVSYAEGPRWLEATEGPLHGVLRKEDPGLALLPFYRRDRPWIEDRGGWNFLTEQQTAGKNFQLNHPFQIDLERSCARIVDEKTVIKFECPSNAMSIVAESLELSGRAAEIGIEVNGIAPREAQFDLDMTRSELAPTCVKAGKARLYLALKEMPPGPREITLKFPTADRAGVALYGVRFSETIPL